MDLPYVSYPENHIEILDTSGTLDHDKLYALFQEARKLGFVFYPIGMGGSYIDPSIFNHIHLTLSPILADPFVQGVLVETVVRFLFDKVVPFISNSIKAKFGEQDGSDPISTNKTVPTIVITHGNRSLTIADPSEESISQAIYEFFHTSGE